jgi:hypothetical protein
MTIVFRAIFLFLFCFACVLFPNSYRRWTHPFSPLRLEIPYEPREEWELVPTVEEKEAIRTILSQPFHYLSKGLQSFVFESQDGQYVLKFFRFDASRASQGQKIVFLARQLLGLNPREPFPLDKRRSKTFRSCLFSYQTLRDETGVIWVHLNPKPNLWPVLIVQDRLGRWHRVDPARVPFTLQKKGSRFNAALQQAFAEDPQQFRNRVDSFVELVKQIEKKGAFHVDPNMGSNFGFLGDQAIQLDFGNYVAREQAKFDSTHFIRRIRSFIRREFPSELAQFDQKWSVDMIPSVSK